MGRIINVSNMRRSKFLRISALASLVLLHFGCSVEDGYPRILMETEMGDIILEVYPDKAPVTAGMDVVNKIHQLPAAGQILDPPVKILKISRLN